MRFFGNSSYHTLWFCKTSKHYTVGFLSFVWLRFHNAPCPSVFVHEIFRLRNSFQHHLPSDRLNHPNCDLSSDDFLVYLYCLPNIYRPLWGKVMFSVMCFCLFTGVCHVTITRDALDFTIHGPPTPKPWRRPPPNIGPHCTGNPQTRSCSPVLTTCG